MHLFYLTSNLYIYSVLVYVRASSGNSGVGT
jgi:hypothetical protein